jgi:hypothetical protein
MYSQPVAVFRVQCGSSPDPLRGIFFSAAVHAIGGTISRSA